MKRKAICLVLAALMTLSLCACGNTMPGDARPGSGTELLPETSPMVSPEADDGMVTDRDGVIGDRDTATPKPGTNQTGTQPSAVPGGTQPTTVPGGTQPTTAPSASPKP